MGMSQELRRERYKGFKIDKIKDAISHYDLILIDDSYCFLGDLSEIEYATSKHINLNLSVYEIYQEVFKSSYRPEIVIFYYHSKAHDDDINFHYTKEYKRMISKLLDYDIQIVMYDYFYDDYSFFNCRKKYKRINVDKWYSDKAIAELDNYLLHKRIERIDEYINRRRYEEHEGLE